MENKRVKMCEVLKVLPPYLDNNEYFNHAFRNLIKECREFVLGAVPIGTYIFTPDTSADNESFTFEMSINTKGTVDAITRKIITSEASGPKAIYESITTVRNQKDGTYTVKKRNAEIQREKAGPLTIRNQRQETTTFDRNDNQLKKERRIYQPESELTFNEDLYNEWSKEVPLQKEITTYYLNRENAIEEERDYISGTNKKFYLQLEDEKEEKKTEISKEIFDTQMSAYNEITASNITSTYGTRLVKIVISMILFTKYLGDTRISKISSLTFLKNGMIFRRLKKRNSQPQFLRQKN